MSDDSPQPAGVPRRTLLRTGTAALAAGAVTLGAGTGVAQAAPATSPPMPDGTRLSGAASRPRGSARGRRGRTRFGIGYETWFGPQNIDHFDSAEAEPVLGKYDSSDPKVIKQHAQWILWAGYDFIMLDWSNNLGGNWGNGVADKIMAGSDALLRTYAGLRKRPQVVLLLGLDNGTAGQTANWKAQIDRIKTKYLADPKLRPLFLEHDGKPLLTVYTGARWTDPPTWDDPDFTVRWMGAFREIVLNPGGQWSWITRAPYADGQSTPVSDFSKGLQGWKADPAWKIAKMPVNAAYPGVPEIQYVSTKPAEGAAQQTGTITSDPFVLTQEVLSFNAIGTDYPAHLTARPPEPAARNQYYLKDAASGEVLRWAEPPGTDTSFMVRQWNVADLKGRKVVFEAVSNRTEGPPVGWIGFFGLQQQRAEMVTAAASLGGNEYYGAYGNWDAQLRMSGATLVRQVQGIYDYEPELALVQQWNEFGAPDQFSVPGSNDIEPTKVTRLDGPNSDGWGFYYLNLVRDLIDQYRAGRSAPRVMLDTRYP
ncbi:hypothetical protein [Actinomadura opuntiae]|uniref:hypothetical protein n=1 Tax=Actinomadura sp. OS1-43 TaxID=604315 RepID=UPI00255ADEA8|nr:hypothetical protein [Actinomadura sp. OS1-43]MDL4821826.1 hypothetical protein [Actinomadura sp. OS1-43]